MTTVQATRKLDATGLSCPMPLLKTKVMLNQMQPGEALEVLADDPGSARDIPAYLRQSIHELVSQSEDQQGYHFVIRSGQPASGNDKEAVR